VLRTGALDLGAVFGSSGMATRPLALVRSRVEASQNTAMTLPTARTRV
jgi:hypothetical protein